MYNSFAYPQTQGYNSGNFGVNGFNVPNLQSQRQEIIRVHGRNGAEVFAMQPNTEILLLDDSQPIVWHKKTDGAGYATLNGYNITPLQTETEKTENKYTEFEKRLSALEEKINAKSDITKFADVKYQTSDKNDKGSK